MNTPTLFNAYILGAMKTIFCVAIFFSSTYSSFAQLPSTQEQEKKYKWGFAAAINSTDAQIGDPEWDSWGDAKGNFFNYGDITNKSLSLSIIPKYFISNDVLLRFEFGMTNISLTNHYDANDHLASNNPLYTIIIDQTIEQKIYRYIPGIQWNFMKKKFIESYCGMTISYSHSNDMHYENIYKNIDLTSNTYTGGFDDKAIATGGFLAGIGAFAGFNIYLQKHISFGAEFSSALLYKRIGGIFSGTSINQSIPNPPVTRTYWFTSSFKGFQFEKVLSSFNISVWF